MGLEDADFGNAVLHCSSVAPRWSSSGRRSWEHSFPVCLFNGFSPHPLSDNCSDLNSELQRVLTGLESVVCGRKKSSCNLSVAEVDRHIEQLTTASEHCDLAIKVGLLPSPLGFLRLEEEREQTAFLPLGFLEHLSVTESHTSLLSYQLEAGAL